MAQDPKEKEKEKEKAELPYSYRERGVGREESRDEHWCAKFEKCELVNP